MATHVVTGAFSYTGKYITRRLLAEGHTVRTLTGHPRPEDPLSARVAAFPLDFTSPGGLREALRGADTLFNTYWIRFARGAMTFERAVENSRALVRAAADAGVRRIVHVSITNASPDSTLPYFRGKGMVEEAIAASGLSYAILRPTVVFGAEDILVNNIAWTVRRFPAVAAAGGDYSLQPIYVDDLASLAVEAAGAGDDSVRDAVGPERYTYEGLVRLIGEAIGKRARIVTLPAPLVYAMAAGLGVLVRDVVLTRDEVRGLTANLLVSDDPPLGTTSLRGWLADNAGALGARYASETARHYR